jgi:hypothetical protein
LTGKGACHRQKRFPRLQNLLAKRGKILIEAEILPGIRRVGDDDVDVLEIIFQVVEVAANEWGMRMYFSFGALINHFCAIRS